MPNITDWLMVIITFVYVVATIFICSANLRSAKATKDQFEEMKKQYEEDNRPYIDVEFVYERRAFYVIRFINRGRFTAYHTKIVLDDDFVNCLQEESFKAMLIKQKGKECIIGAGQHYDLFIGTDALRKNPNILPATGKITYDANGKTYSTDIYIDLANYMTFFTSTSEHEELIKVLKDIKNELNVLERRVSICSINQERK